MSQPPMTPEPAPEPGEPHETQGGPARSGDESRAPATDPEQKWEQIVSDLRAENPAFDTPELMSSGPLGPVAAPTWQGPNPGSNVMAGPRDYSPPEDAEDFEPPDPAPLTSAAPAVSLAWLVTVSAPIALLLCALLWREAPMAVIVTLIVLFLAAVSFLVWRLPARRSDEDDGARV